jgi:hypothetical protein
MANPFAAASPPAPDARVTQLQAELENVTAHAKRHIRELKAGAAH